MHDLLRGIRVLELAHMVAGPYGTLQMAYMGADVIKVESQQRPDTWRLREGNADIERSVPFGEHNRNKRSISINLKERAGVDLIRRLVVHVDAVVENYSAGVVDRLGLGYEDLKCVRPDLIMVSLQGMGRESPRRDYVAWGPNQLSFCGFTHLWNHPGTQVPVGSQTSYPDRRSS